MSLRKCSCDSPKITCSPKTHDFLGATTSFCPVCLNLIPAIFREDSSGVVMDKTCPHHGRVITVVSSDSSIYAKISRMSHQATMPISRETPTVKGCPEDCGLCPEHDQHTCLAILEITSRCDLMCPVCLAASVPKGFDLPPPIAQQALQKLLRSEGRATPLQLSGGEPTLHMELEEILRRAKSLGFPDIEINTNGLALSRDASLASRLREAGLSLVYLQMDGFSSNVSKWIRGRDLVEDKIRAIENCNKAGLQVAVAVTVVPGVNDAMLWDMVRFGMEHAVRGVNFQSVVLNGRFPVSLTDGKKRFTMGHFLNELARQSNGIVQAADLTHVPSVEKCSAIMYALVDQDKLLPLNRLVNGRELTDLYSYLADWDDIIRRINPEDTPARPLCGCCAPSSFEADTPLGEILSRSDFFSVGYHGMMDAYNFDLARARRCCVQALTPDGRLIPFCLYNIKYRHQFQTLFADI